MQKTPMSRAGITYYVFGRSVRPNPKCREALIGEVLFHIPKNEFVLIENMDDLAVYRKLPPDDIIVMMRVGRGRPRSVEQNQDFRPRFENADKCNN